MQWQCHKFHSKSKGLGNKIKKQATYDAQGNLERTPHLESSHNDVAFTDNIANNETKGKRSQEKLANDHRDEMLSDIELYEVLKMPYSITLFAY